MGRKNFGQQSSNRASKRNQAITHSHLEVQTQGLAAGTRTSSTTHVPLNEYVIDDARHLGSVLSRQPIIDVTITSPPYWDAKDYGKSNQIGFGQSLNGYLDDLVAVFTDVWHCTKRDGSLWVIINTIKKDRTLHLLPFKLAERLTSLSAATWHLQDILVWVKPHTLPWAHKDKLQDHFEYVLCFSKSRSFALNTNALRSPQFLANWWVKYPERYHPLGKGLNNVWEIHIPTQGAWGNGSIEHACPLPTELARRIIQLASEKHGIVCDPFAGTGATVVAAQSLGRKWIALDINPRYREMCHKRLAEESAAGKDEEKDATSLFNANLHLRQLKYAVLLFKRIAPGLRLTAEDVPLLAVRKGTPLRHPKPHWVTGCQLVIVVSDEMKTKKLTELSQLIERTRRAPPVSKFQIETDVKIVRQSDFAELGLFSKKGKLSLYTCGRFWRPMRQLHAIELASVVNKSKFPLLVSNIHVDEEPAY